MIGNRYIITEMGFRKEVEVITPEEAAKGMGTFMVSRLTDPEYVFVKEVKTNTTRLFNKKLLLEEGRRVEA